MLDEPIKSVAPELQIDGSTAATFELDGHKWTYDRKILAEEFEQSETGSSCPVCQITRFRRKFEIADSDYFIADCETCGLGRLLPSPTNEQISEFYEPAYYGVEGCKFSSSSEISKSIRNSETRSIFLEKS